MTTPVLNFGVVFTSAFAKSSLKRFQWKHPVKLQMERWTIQWTKFPAKISISLFCLFYLGDVNFPSQCYKLYSNNKGFTLLKVELQFFFFFCHSKVKETSNKTSSIPILFLLVKNGNVKEIHCVWHVFLQNFCKFTPFCDVISRLPFETPRIICLRMEYHHIKPVRIN